MILEAVSTLTSKVEGEDIVWTIWKHIDAVNSAGMVLRTILNTSWGDYSQFFQNLMQQYIAVIPQRVVFFAHTSEVVDNDKIAHVLVKVKGSLMNQGIESFFSNVISTKKVKLNKLDGYRDNNSLLTITPKEEILGIKHVFQTQITKETINERMRGPEDPPMWSIPETFIDNDLELVFKRLNEYYTAP